MKIRYEGKRKTPFGPGIVSEKSEINFTYGRHSEIQPAYRADSYYLGSEGIIWVLYED